MGKREISDFSEERARLERLLREMQQGDTLSYAQIEAEIGLRAGSPEFDYVYTQVSRVMRYRDAVMFSRRGRNKTVRRLTSDDIAILSERGMTRMQDTARRISSDATRAAQSNDISSEGRIRAAVVASVATLVSSSTSTVAVEMVRREVERTGNVIPLQETLALFRVSRKNDDGDR